MEELQLLLQQIKDSVIWVSGLAKDVGTITGEPICYDELSEVNGYRLSLATSGKLLAYVYPTIEGFRVVSNGEWAIEAGLTSLVDEGDNGWWGKPAVYWKLSRDDSAGYRHFVADLARIVQVRQTQPRLQRGTNLGLGSDVG